MSTRKTKWAKVIADLQASPGEWQKVAVDVGPSIAQRLRELGAEVSAKISSPRSGTRTYDRYTLHARWPDPENPSDTAPPASTGYQGRQTQVKHANSKWAAIVATLQHSPGEWMQVAEDAGPSTIQRLRELGAEVQTDSIVPRTKEQTYGRYMVWARWPTPQTELERLELELTTHAQALAELRKDLDAAEDEYNSDKKRLNRSAYRRRQLREKYEPLLAEHDQLTARINQMTTPKD